uniref:Uncharacterized protein n=1 Tax=Salarias fasciatus TaxID=181472 RepID=A0A672J2X5_SALFA
SAISSGSLEQSLPAAALRSCRMRGRCSLRPQGTKTWSSSKPGIWTWGRGCCGFRFQEGENSSPLPLTLRSILAKPRALDARSLASWNSSFSERLVSITEQHPLHLISSDAVLSSALSQNSLSLFCRPTSRNSPVDLSSIPAMSGLTYQKSFPDCASPPRMYGVMTLVKFHSSSKRFFRLWEA